MALESVSRRLVVAAFACAIALGGAGRVASAASSRCGADDTIRVVDGVAYACFGPARNLRWVRLQTDRPVVDVAVAERPAGTLIGSGLFDVTGRRFTGPGPAEGVRCGRKGNFRLGWFYFANVAAWFEYSSGEMVVAPMGRSDRWLVEDSLTRDKGLPARRTREPFTGELYGLPWGWTYEEAPGAFGICRFFPAIADTVVDNGFFTSAGEKFTNSRANGSFVTAGQPIGVAQVDMLPDSTPYSGQSREAYPCTIEPGPNGSWRSTDGKITLWWRYASGLQRTMVVIPGGAKPIIDNDGLRNWSNNKVAVIVDMNQERDKLVCWLLQIKLNP